MRTYAVLAVLQFLGIGAAALDSDLAVIQTNEAVRLISKKTDAESILDKIRPQLQKWYLETASAEDDHQQACFIFPQNERRPFVVLCTVAKSYGVVAAFIDTNNLIRPRKSVLRALFGLTRTESEVATRVASGQSTAEIAAELNSAVATVRVQLKSTLKKTKTRRQSELAAVLGRVSILSGQQRIHVFAQDELVLD